MIYLRRPMRHPSNENSPMRGSGRNPVKVVTMACIASFVVLCQGVAQSPTHPTTSRHPPASVCGHWVVTKVVPTSGISTSPRKDFLGLEAEYLPSEMRFGNKVVVRNPLYRVERQSVAEFFKQSYDRLSELGIKGDSVLIIDVLDENGKDVIRPGAVLHVRNSHQIITLWEGVYYLLERKGAPCAEKSSASR